MAEKTTPFGGAKTGEGTIVIDGEQKPISWDHNTKMKIYMVTIGQPGDERVELMVEDDFIKYCNDNKIECQKIGTKEEHPEIHKATDEDIINALNEVLAKDDRYCVCLVNFFSGTLATKYSDTETQDDYHATIKQFISDLNKKNVRTDKIKLEKFDINTFLARLNNPNYARAVIKCEYRLMFDKLSSKSVWERWSKYLSSCRRHH